MDSILAKADSVRLWPYPHVVIPDCLPQSLVDELDATFPEQEILRVPHVGEGVRVDLPSMEALEKLDSTWVEFIRYHTSQEFWHDVLDLFGDVMNVCYPLLHLQYGNLRELDCGPRRVEMTTLQMECQPGVNTAQTVAQRVRGPHLDNPVELYGGLLYMGDGEGGDLEIQRLIKGPKFHGKLEIKDKCVETVSTVKYQKNMLVFFLNTPVSIHSVTTRPASEECRRLINIVGELPNMLFKTGHGEY